MSHFKHHVFFCTNKRQDGSACCEDHGASALRAYAKQKLKAIGNQIPGKVRINTAGCLDRCAAGPVLVVYPEAVWYSYVDKEDIDEIFESHLKKGKVVERLLVENQS
ncbi:MAG: (2Fe-2S) ferredoxin domain-containing protein [Gammaproteobacteria bacterium]|nr:(2Fe-2S) ferredoxin domain-containing protein [Gammaproteobacteria bacterium]